MVIQALCQLNFVTGSTYHCLSHLETVQTFGVLYGDLDKVEPIYKDSQYRWLNYQKHLEQYLERVEPWISEFGYD